MASLPPGAPVAVLAAVPGLVLVEPCCEREGELALDWCVRTNAKSSYLRLVSISVDVPFALPADYVFAEGRGAKLTAGDDVLVIGYGPVLLSEAWKAAERLRAEGIEATLVNLPWLNRIDLEWFAASVRPFRRVVALDNHYVGGGQGDFLARSLFRGSLERLPQLLQVGVEEIPRCGLNPEVLAAHGLDVAGLAKRIAAFVSR